MVNFGYHTAKFQGQFIRSIYTKLIDKVVHTPLSQNRRVNITVYAFSCERDLSLQVANIRSFIRHVGIPEKFIVISDGSYSSESSRLLCQINSCVNVIEWKDLLQGDIPKYVLDYALHHPNRAIQAFWKRLAVFMSLSIEQPIIYTDADILFFPGAGEIINLCQLEDNCAWYLPDCQASLDERILLDDAEKINPVNAGFFLLKRQIDWQKPLERAAQLIDSPIYFTDQTLVHLAMHNAQAKPLDRDKFILSVDDQFMYTDLYAKGQIAMRHYVSDIRHKFWLNLAF
ncbi:hypothetical protein [Calothrix sp. NIES-2098]|uniref:hypothetical protein n=1 Tax=Calothrix sp. NIES-2098 TaxID=1954171 RepID=UPI000B5EC2DD|nr:hypothetical protein NIES2098_66230 [Calothrix sp. NIES-2098]